ncbi:MAG: hypothetical protein E6J69_01510 [Deltaproteobacteria bacterium]|nr:MAG: hypothetical protein E6J69_01510 [Deltaproteobacteria bacterium]
MATIQTLPEAATLFPAASASGAPALAARSFFYSVFKHRRLVIGVFLLVFVASATMALLRPRTWRATTKVLVKVGEAVQLAPAEAPSRSINVPLNPDVIAGEAEIVKSRQVLEEAVGRLGIKPEAGSSLGQMISGMQLALTVAPAPGSNVLQISYLGRYPDRAARLVNTLTDVYVDHHNRAYANEGIHSFYADQLRILEAEMKVAQHRLRAYLRRTKVVDADQEIHILNQDLQDAEKSLRGHRQKIRGGERKLVEITAQLARTPAHVPYSEEYRANPTIQTFKDRLAGLEIERYQALQRYLPDDRHIRDKDEEIANVRARLAGEKDRVLNVETVQESAIYRELQRNRLTIEAALADLREREAPMGEHVSALRKHVHELRDQRFMINNLKQVADEKAYAFDLYWRKQEEARISEAMKTQSIVNVIVVERATPPLEPENGLLLPLLLGLASGLLVGAGMAIAVEYLNRRLRFEEEVEHYLELPVLAVVPELHTAPDIAHG